MSKVDATQAPFIRRKGHLSVAQLRLLALLALIPLLMMLARTLALPGALASGLVDPLGFIRSIGAALNQHASLMSLPYEERNRVMYLLFVPMCAMLVTLVRLTFGVPVLGFRSILIAVGFHEAGLIPSLFLIAAVVITVALVRPRLKQARLPLYARVSVILCLVAATMVAAVLAGPWMDSDALWGVVYFPVIVLGMLAEGIARTLHHDNLTTASWRAATTVVLALLLAAIGWIPALRETLLQFPELVVLELVAIVMIAEFLDLRLLEAWSKRAGGIRPRDLRSRRGTYRVAVVRNRDQTGIIGRLGRRASAKQAQRSVQGIVDALRAGGHTVTVMEGDKSLLGKLGRFMPPNPDNERPGGIVLNLAGGIQGQGRPMHVPAMLEMAGIAYAGPSLLSHASILDRVVTKSLLQQAGVLTPAFCLLGAGTPAIVGLQYPLIVKPRYEPDSGSKIIDEPRQLRRHVKAAIERYRQEVLVEEYLGGPQISVALLGNSPVECLPLVELDDATGEKVCPAQIDGALAQRIRSAATAAFQACGCRDYARIGIRVSVSGEPVVVEITTTNLFRPGGTFATAAAADGQSFSQLLCRIVDVARTRYVPRKAVRPLAPPPVAHAPSRPLLSRSGQ